MEDEFKQRTETGPDDTEVVVCGFCGGRLRLGVNKLFPELGTVHNLCAFFLDTWHKKINTKKEPPS